MGAVMDLTIEAMRSKEEAKLKSILAALWHLSSNSDDTKAEICAVEGALAFLVDMLDYEAPSKTSVVAENASGVLKNVSSHVASRDDYKTILREKQWVAVLLRHLKSQSTVLVNNVCGTICNLSKFCSKDQQILWDSILDSQSMSVLQNLSQSKHKGISTNASVLLRSLLGAKCHNSNMMGLSMTNVIPTYNVPIVQKDINVNVRTDKENARAMKRTFNKEITYCANQSYMSINTRTVDNYKIMNNRSDVRFQGVSEKVDQRKIKYCAKPSLRDENYDARKVKEMVRTSVPVNSPSETDNFIRLRACSSPVDENSPPNELLDNSSETANVVINKISPPYVKQRYCPNYVQNGSARPSPIFDMTPEKGNNSFDEDVNDQPIDFSKKYVERNATSTVIEPRPERRPKKEYVQRSKVNLFGDYAETDIDQPTNYSLRYAEDDTDEDEKPEREYFATEQEDTVQTYCTEGTPYQTPLAFSTSTSMSDLREPKDAKRPKELKQKQVPVLSIKVTANCDEPCAQTSIPKESKELVLNLGIMSPEKPVNYCEEGTPGYFSRVSSLSSLNSAMAGMNISAEATTDKVEEALNDSCESEKVVDEKAMEKFKSGDHVDGPLDPKIVSSGDKEVAKTVSFGTDGLCNETPLMFSRCSSLSDLSGFEQHSIPEDRSSIYDFSRRTSGLISPSEIPDSPSQTVPPSPKHHKSPSGEFSRKTLEDRSSARNSLTIKPLVTMRSIFEDEMATYKEESTPVVFSAATSLSSLTIDDDIPRVLDDLKDKVEESPEQPEDGKEESIEKTEETQSDKERLSDDEDDEDILAACINMGMRNNRYRQSSKKSHKPAGHPAPPVPAVTFPRYQPSNLTDSAKSPPSSKSKPVAETVSPDTMHIYCTEDTPADISPFGSHSNLSALSLASIPDYSEELALAADRDKVLEETERKGELSDESSNLSGDEEKLLDKCIQSGMPKKSQNQGTCSRAAAIPVKKCKDEFKLCGTPSTSPVEPVPEPPAPSALCPQYTTLVPEIETEIFDDSSNHSEDEAILAECIKSAMPKAVSALPVVARLSPGVAKLAPVSNGQSNLCSCPTVSPLRPSYLPSKRMEPSEDSLSISEEEEDLMLAQCIKSGMPKEKQRSSTTKTAKNWKKS